MPPPRVTSEVGQKIPQCKYVCSKENNMALSLGLERLASIASTDTGSLSPSTLRKF